MSKIKVNILKKLSDWGFRVNPLNKKITGIKNLMKNYNLKLKKREVI